MKTIETSRLIIRNFTLNDWEQLKKMIIQFESSPYAAYDEQWPTSDEEIKKITQWFASGDSFFAVCLKDNGLFIGYIALNKSEDKNEYNLGYRFDFDYHGNGYATESCQAIIEYAFIELNAEKIVASTALDNQPSCNLLFKLGMRKISEKVVSFKKDLNGKPIEFLGADFELLRDEWKSKRTM